MSPGMYASRTWAEIPEYIHEGTFDDSWEKLDLLGRGSTSQVFRCRLKPRGGKGDNAELADVDAAVKIVTKRRLGVSKKARERALAHIRDEVTVLKELDHPCIIKLLASYETDSEVFIVTELLEGGELFDVIVEREHLHETEASKIVRRVAWALEYLHERDFIHRDLKPENLLLAHKDDTSVIKVIDFGFSKHCVNTKSFLGTQGYLAPEMLRRKEYTKAVDMWALGVCTYALLSGYLPFDDDPYDVSDDEDEDDKGDEGKSNTDMYEVKFPEEQWASVSEEAKSLIRALLRENPEERMTAREVMRHPWIHHSRSSRNYRKSLQSPANLRTRSESLNAAAASSEYTTPRRSAWKFFEKITPLRGGKK